MKGRVLIIDGDHQHTASLGEELKSRGYEVRTEGSQVAENLDAFAPTAIITDASAPGIDAFAVLRELRARQPHTPIILIAKDSSVEIAVRAIQE